jgi:hypothetical protein
VLWTRRDGDAASVFAMRMAPFRRRRLRANLLRAASVTIWSAGLLGILLIAGLAFAGLQSGR